VDAPPKPLQTRVYNEACNVIETHDHTSRVLNLALSGRRKVLYEVEGTKITRPVSGFQTGEFTGFSERR
jgi:hypothetical protein